ncbi:uncharacterized protein [Palaemon carinicauda]|uniref:uncharacterized protein n=1 Tax=Palaemon carinicauda TaxID=392227 RepID=UPI0035B5CFB5
MRWRLELSCFNFDITYRLGSKNQVADAFSHASGCVASLTCTQRDKLTQLQEHLCHPGIRRMTPIIRQRNLPFTIEEARTVILSGLPQYIHSDRGPAFGSSVYQKFLHYHGVATSYLSAFNPRGNGQIERANGTLWCTIRLALASLSLPIEMWEAVLDQALHSMRSLLYVVTN